MPVPVTQPESSAAAGADIHVSTTCERIAGKDEQHDIACAGLAGTYFPTGPSRTPFDPSDATGMGNQRMAQLIRAGFYFDPQGKTNGLRRKLSRIPARIQRRLIVSGSNEALVREYLTLVGNAAGLRLNWTLPSRESPSEEMCPEPYLRSCEMGFS